MWAYNKLDKMRATPEGANIMEVNKMTKERMTREEAQAKVNARNEELKNYKEHEMLETLGVKDGQKVSANEWFSLWNQAYNLLDTYYKKGIVILEECRADGHDVKINMQTYELTLY